MLADMAALVKLTCLSGDAVSQEDFAVQVAGSGVTIASAATAGAKVTLTLGNHVLAGQAVTYVSPPSPLNDMASCMRRVRSVHGAGIAAQCSVLLVGAPGRSGRICSSRVPADCVQGVVHQEC